MNKQKGCGNVRLSVLAVHAAILAVAPAPLAYAQSGPSYPAASATALAATPTERDLTQRANLIEAGVGYVTQDSAKFGQYNGLFDKGAFGILNFDVGNSPPYDSGDPFRWRVYGSDVGLDTRALLGEVGQQGLWRAFLNYDELRSNWSDTFQTPYLGVGSNTLTLPSNWIKPIVPQVSATAGNFRALSPTTGLASALVNGVVTPPTAAQAATVNQILANDVPDFHNVDLNTTRKVYAGGFSYNFGPRWEFKASASQTKLDGLKALNMISLANGTFSATFPNLIDQKTDQYNVSIGYTGDRLFFTAAYYGSFFRNNVPGMTFENAFVPGTFSTQSTAPDNDFNQFVLKGGYNFSPTTKLVLGGSYGRNTQNAAFLTDPTIVSAGASSLNGRVITEMFTAKLSGKPLPGWNYNVGYTYNNRDNQTPVNTYIFYDASEPKTGASSFNTALGYPAGTLGSNINIYANRPYSARTNTFTADGQYQLARGQFLKANYQYQQVDRDCPGSWINCADATQTREHTLGGAWDATYSDSVSARLSYAYSERRVDYDENAWLSLVPMAGVVPGAPTVGANVSVATFLAQTGLGGYGPIAPYTPLQPGNLGIFFPNNSALPQALYGSRNDIHEIPGMRRFNMADRNRNKARGSVDWQALERVSLQAGIDYLDDDYKNSVYGLRKSTQWAANLEANWQVSETVSATLWYSYQDQKLESAGISYSAGAISNTATVGGVAGNTVVSGGCYSTVADKNANAKIDPCLNWGVNERDYVNALGGGANWKGLMSGRLDLWGDVVFTWAKTKTGVTGGTYANNPFALANLPAINPAAIFIPAGDLPTVVNDSVELRLVGQYAIDKASTVRLGYMYGHLKSTDYAYDGMQYGTITSVMPNNQTAPSYNVHVVGLSYVYRWQ